MKTFALTTALIASLAAPAFAEHSPGNAQHNAVATAIFAAEAASDDDRIGYSPTTGTEVISTQSFGHNPVATRIFAAERAASLEDE